MDAISSVSPHSKAPEVRPRLRDEPGFAFLLEHGPIDAPAQRFPLPSSVDAQERSPLAQACAWVSGASRPQTRAELAALASEHPDILEAPRISRDERGTPIQAFPALALAALSGHDPEGWAPVLAELGARLSPGDALDDARCELLEMGPPRGRLTALVSRCDALSLWTLACAEALHPHSALRAVERLRLLLPMELPPLDFDLARFDTDPAWDKPGLKATTRAGAFIEAARSAPGFFDATLPSWIRGPRGADILAIAVPLVAALDESEAGALRQALSQAREPAALALLASLGLHEPH